MAEQLVVENLVKHYPVKGGIIPHTVAQIKAVDDVSFTIEGGTTLGLVGESGCGKSTIGRQIVALEKPTSGKIMFDGEDITKISSSECCLDRLLLDCKHIHKLRIYIFSYLYLLFFDSCLLQINNRTNCL